jgi:predicted dehydrogenase
MKVLVIGGGSMGRRRLRDLKALWPGEVMLLEPNEARCREIAGRFGVRGFTKLDDAFATQPDALAVCTPPALHEPYVREGIKRKLHIFAEVPFIMDLAAMEGVARQAPSYPAVLAMSHAPRYYPPFVILRDQIRRGVIGRPLYVEHSLGNYLPEWHPYEDYRTFYGGDWKLGGAGLDMIPHEFDALLWWLGPLSRVQARFSKLSSLELNGPDTQDVLLTFASGAVGYFHNDVIERGTTGRHVRIAGEEGTLEWHQGQPSVRLFLNSANKHLGFDAAPDWADAQRASHEVARLIAESKAVSGKPPADGSGEYTYEANYFREMEHFVGAATGRHAFTTATVEDELAAVRAMHAIIRSGEEERAVAL